MSDYGSKQGRANSVDVVALEQRVKALESGYYRRGSDVVIGMPAATGQGGRTPRLIIVDPTNGRTYHVRIDAGTLVANLITL